MMKKLLTAVLIFCWAIFYGQSWITQNTGFTSPFRGISQIHVLDPSIVWALALDGSGSAGAAEVQEFTRTINGGTTWIPGFIDIGFPAYSINNIIPVTASTAWVSAIDLSLPAGSPTPGGIWKTTNAGVSWVRQNATAFIGGSSFINGVHFWNMTEGIAFGDPVAGNKIECYRTIDGGTTWTSVTTVPNMLTGEYNYNSGNVFIGNAIFLPTNKGKILRSTDRGLTWLKLNGPAAITDFGADAINGKIYFSDTSMGCILGTTDTGATYKLYTTSNGGISWITPTTNFAGGFNRNLSYVPGTPTIVACGSLFTSPAVSGSSYSNNNGDTFTQIDTGDQRGFVSMLNGSTGWCGGFNSVSSAGVSSGGIFKFSGALSNNSFTSAKKFTMSPNPTTGFINLSGTIPIDEVIIYDLLGKTVYKKAFNAVLSTMIDINALQNGAYIVKVFSESGFENIKIIKK